MKHAFILGFAAFCVVFSLARPCASDEAREPALVERFQGDALSRLELHGGRWAVSGEIEMFDIEERDIYKSPEEPGHLRWCGLVKGKDGVLQASFSQLTGNLGLEPSYRPCHWRDDKTWLAKYKAHRMRIGPQDAISTTKLERPTLLSFDHGETWVSPDEAERPFVPDDRRRGGAGYRNLYCRDGRIVSTAKQWEWASDGGKYRQYLLGIRESTDKGKTYTPMQWIAPDGTDPEMLKESTEESAMVELDDGRILVMIRCDPGRPLQTYLTRVASGKYEATLPTLLPMPHSGFPELLQCTGGVIWYWGIDGHWYTEDQGKTWRRAPIRLRQYYGRMVEAARNSIVCVTQHSIGDSPYPYWYDSSIRMYRFSYRRSGILEQTNAQRRMVRAVLSHEEFTDIHLRADIRIDGANGLVFRVSPDGKSYYMFAVILPKHPLYDAYFPPEAQDEKLAANYTRADTFQFALDWPMAVLARAEAGKITILRGLRIEENPKKGAWTQVQVKVRGDLVQAALKIAGRALYVSAHDAGLPSGSVGFFTDRSTGAFRNLEVWEGPQMIRDNWR